MQAVVILVVVALVSLLVTRVATVALVVTGMPQTAARFQARSALTGVGFTTSEAEGVVNHPVRRRIVMALMLLGNLGLATGIAGVLGGFVRADASEGAVRGAILISGLAAVYALSRSAVVDRRLSRLLRRLLSRYTDLETRDYERLLRLSGDHSIKETHVSSGSWMADRTLGELRLRDEGVLVIGVVRADGGYVGVPDKRTQLAAGDGLILYGRDESIVGLGDRPAGDAGDRAHADAVDQHAVRAR